MCEATSDQNGAFVAKQKIFISYAEYYLQDFSKALSRLISLLDKRQHNLTNCHQRECLIGAMTALKKCVPMLKSSMQTSVKYPKNAKVLVSEDI